MESLIALQQFHFAPRTMAATEAKISRLRQEVPEQILAYYERLIARGKKGVSLARNGVCCECHLRIPWGKLVSLAHTDEIHRCDNCGRYLHLPDDELIRMQSPTPPAPAKVPAKRPARRTTAHVG